MFADSAVFLFFLELPELLTKSSNYMLCKQLLQKRAWVFTFIVSLPHALPADVDMLL